MATAEMTIDANILIEPMGGEPIHEFRGNDATSDSSSHTFGRTSPASKRPSMKEIDEAKKPKALIEQRPTRQIRSKKHVSVHSVPSSKTDSTDSTEEVAAESSARTRIVAPASLVALIKLHDGTYMVSPDNWGFHWQSNSVEQQEQPDSKNEMKTIGPRALKPMPTSETMKSTPTPEKPYEKSADVEAPSPEVEKSKEKLRQFDLKEAAKKKKFA
jgi:hypothetical protein